MKTAKKSDGTTKKSTDIPLDNIPERAAKKHYPDEFKLAAVARVNAGESAVRVARDLGIPSDSVLNKWVNVVRSGGVLNKRGGDRKGVNFKPTNSHSESSASVMLQAALMNAQRARDDRLEAAAAIVEIDGNAPELAKKIRTLKRQT